MLYSYVVVCKQIFSYTAILYSIANLSDKKENNDIKSGACARLFVKRILLFVSLCYSILMKLMLDVGPVSITKYNPQNYILARDKSRLMCAVLREKYSSVSGAKCV